MHAHGLMYNDVFRYVGKCNAQQRAYWDTGDMTSPRMSWRERAQKAKTEQLYAWAFSLLVFLLCSWLCSFVAFARFWARFVFLARAWGLSLNRFGIMCFA